MAPQIRGHCLGAAALDLRSDEVLAVLAAVQCRYSAAAFLSPIIDWPVLAQSARNAARPLSVSGCWNICRSTAGGKVATWAPILAAAVTCSVERTEATRTSVLSCG